MVSKKISEILAEEHSKVHLKTLCISCEWVGKTTNNPSTWKCNRPNLVRRNYVDGTVDFVPVSCADWNDDGKCSYYERHMISKIPEPVEEEKTALVPIPEKSLWKRVVDKIRKFFGGESD